MSIKTIERLFESKIENNTTNNIISKHYYRQKRKIDDAFDDEYIEYKYQQKNYQSNNTLKIKPYLGGMIDDLRTSGEEGIHLTMKVNFMSSKYSNEKRFM